MSARGNKKQRFGFRNRRNGPNKNAGPKRNYNGCAQREFRHTEQLSENEVGITEYISTLEGFSGVIKARYSDFHVNEIDLNGQIAVLTDTTIPRHQKCDVDFNTIDQSPIEIISDSKWNEIKEMMKSDSCEPIKLDVNGLSKDERRNIHSTIKSIFGQKLSTDTVIGDNEVHLVVKKSRPDGKERYSWPKDRGIYVHFLLYKEALDTMNACYHIADALKMNPSWFSYAGIKDKRAKTTQWFSVKQVEPWKLIIKTKKLRHIKIGNITFKDIPLKLGHLSGNKFKMAIRNIEADDDIIQKAVEQAGQQGFINYYGLQRFGNDKEVPTFSIGLHLLLGNWKEACNLILKPKMSDEPECAIAKAKKLYAETGDIEKACECLPNHSNNSVEAKLLEGLAKEHKNDYVNALATIPRNMRLFYIHSFQSLIWNKMVSIRLKKYGLKPVENDLIVINNIFNEPELNPVEEDEVDKTDGVVDGQNSEASKTRAQVRALTKPDLSQYTISDIVLPLPGYDVVYPENLKDEYKKELEEHGLTLEMPKQSVKTYTLSGAYRKIVSRLQDLKWKIMKYNDPHASLILSDFDILRKFTEPVDIPDGKYKALILEFSLESSVYATMALREIMKVNTAASAQVKLNDYDNTGNQPKKIASTNDSSEEKFETIDGNTSGSLLNDQQKLEAFKKSIFAEVGVKRKSEEDENNSKKQKTDE